MHIEMKIKTALGTASSVMWIGKGESYIRKKEDFQQRRKLWIGKKSFYHNKPERLKWHFIRKTVLEKEIYELDLEPLRDLYGTLSVATNKINQIAREQIK